MRARHTSPTPRPLAALALLALLAAPAAARAQGARSARLDPAVLPAEGVGPRALTAVALRLPVVVDGRLDDPAWADAPLAADFVQRRPDGGRPASQRSEARVLYDAEAVYVALRLHDAAPDSVAATLGRRDFAGYSDWAHVLIDSYHDRRTSFRFAINPAGVKADAFLSGDDEMSEDRGWDAVWDGAVARDSLGWTAEMRIPLSQLRFSATGPDGEGATWGIQFMRDLARRGERSLWAPVAPDANGFVSHFGELRDLRLRPVRRLETLPYLTSRVTRAPGDAADPYHSPSRLFGALGADVRYGLTSDLTLTATLNPDFGQVEADPSMVNLSGSELFLAEQRPFFLEGGDIFRLQLADAPWIHGTEELFYSRRIGRAPRGGAPDGAAYADAPAATRLLGAAKLSGKTAGGWSVGVLNALTAEERARFVAADGTEGTAQVEPLTSYTVARLIRDSRRGASALGVVAAATRRDPGEQGDLLTTSALVAGVDGRHRFSGGDWQLSGALLGSRLGGDAEAVDAVMRNPVHRYQRPDAGHLEYDLTRTSLSGLSATLRLQKIGGGRVRGGAAGRLVTPGFDANDLGFHTASDFGRLHLWAGYEQFTPGPQLRSWSVWSNNWSAWSLGGEPIGAGSELYADATLRSQWSAAVMVRRELGALDPRALRGGPALYGAGRTRGMLRLASNPRAPLGLSAQVNAFRSDEGGRLLRLAPALSLRPSDRANLRLEPAIAWNSFPAMWVGSASVGDSTLYVGGQLRQSTASLTARLNYTFTPELSLQVYAQPFVSAGRYPTLIEVADPRARRYDDRFRAYAPGQLALSGDAARYAVDRDGDGAADYDIDNPDFHLRQLNSSAVLRWEYRPGSTVFLVWSQGRSADGGDGSFDLDRDVARLWRDPATTTLQLKWTHWVGW